MPTSIVCPKCQAKLNLPDTALGKRVRCPKCSSTLQTPAAPGGPAASGGPAAGAAKPAAAAGVGGKTTIRCPGCSKQLAVGASAAGKIVQCPQCSKKLRVPGGAPAAPPGAAPQRRPGQPGAASRAQAPQPAAPSSSGFPDFGAPAAPAGGDLDIFGGTGAVLSGPAPAAAPASPYAPPAYAGGGFTPPRPASGGGGGGGGASTPLIINGVLITIWGILMILGSIIRGAQIGIGLANLGPDMVVNWPRLSGLIVGTIVGLIMGIVLTRGGIGMAMRNSLSSARAAAVVAAIPCFGCILFPFGIWACVLVFGANARKDFTG